MENLLFDFISNYIHLSEEEKNEIRTLDIFQTVKKGTALLEEGQKSNSGYFVLKGCLRTYYLKNGEEKTTDFFMETELLTPQCAIDNKPSEQFISAVEDSIITVGNLESEDEMFERFPRFEKLCRLLAEEMVAKQRIDFDHFKTSSPEERYLSILESRPDLIQRVPQNQLASYLGVTPQSLSRIRARIIDNERK